MTQNQRAMKKIQLVTSLEVTPALIKSVQALFVSKIRSDVCFKMLIMCFFLTIKHLSTLTSKARK